MTLNVSASVIVIARNHNAHVSVTSVIMDNPRLSVAHTTARHPTAKPNVKGDPTVATTHVSSKAVLKARIIQEVITAKNTHARRAIVG